MAHHQQTAVLAGVLDVVKRLVELLFIDTRGFLDPGGIGQRTPSALGVGRREIVAGEWSGQRHEGEDGQRDEVPGETNEFCQHVVHHTEIRLRTSAIHAKRRPAAFC